MARKKKTNPTLVEEMLRDTVEELRSIPALKGVDLSTLSEDQIDGFIALHREATSEYIPFEECLRRNGLKSRLPRVRNLHQHRS